MPKAFYVHARLTARGLAPRAGPLGFAELAQWSVLSFGGLSADAGVSGDRFTLSGRITSLSSCSTMWQCQTQ